MEVVNDLIVLGDDETRVKWKVPDSTWNAYIDRWREYLPPKAVRIADKISSSVDLSAGCDSCPHPCQEVIMLRGYKLAIEQVSVMVQIQKVKNGNIRALKRRNTG